MVKIKKLIQAWIPDGVKKDEYTLTVTDVFGTPLTPLQEVLYAREQCGRIEIFVGKILGIASDGSLFLEWGRKDDKFLKTSTISKHSEVLNADLTGEARYDQIYVAGK